MRRFYEQSLWIPQKFLFTNLDLHHGLLNMDWSQDSFAPIPLFVDTGSSLLDKNNVAAFLQLNKSMIDSMAQSHQ